MSFRRIRILLLLGVLIITLGLTSLERFMVREWKAPLDVAIYPINGDGSEEAADYIRALSAEDFLEINAFLVRETHRYGLQQRVSMTLSLEPEMKASPPPPPMDRNVLKTMAWSLNLRWWAYQHSPSKWPQLGKIRLYVLYHQAKPGQALEHSLGLQKGLIGVVHAFADPKQTAQNNIVIAHEMLHTLGATDKYGPDGRPVYPVGYAEPELPQDVRRREAEIMAGRIALPDGRNLMPASLAQCLIGSTTAHEINLNEAFRNN
jgi:hypothetical protein